MHDHFYTAANGAKMEKFSRAMKKVPTKIMSGKLGDMAVRLGRYKLIRYNTPKDLRTGPTRQHLVAHEGTHWHDSPEEKRCYYDISGKLLTPNCEVKGSAICIFGLKDPAGSRARLNQNN